MPKVNLHTHSALSDGTLSPEALAEYLADSGVAWAALTDHDTVAGSARFREALARRGVGCIDGIELSGESPLGLVHILAYGASPGFVDSIASGLAAGGGAASGGANGGLPRTSDLVRAIRGAGGAAFLAHPFTVSRELGTLKRLVAELAESGLAGIEALYGPYSTAERHTLLSLAKESRLAVCAGSDFHEPGIPGQSGPVEMDDEQWAAFRGLLLSPSANRASAAPRKAPPARGFPRNGRFAARFAARIVAPALVAMSLFVVAFFAVEIPQFSRMLLERKKETIRELTRSASSILLEYARDAEAGSISLAQAKIEAAGRIRDIRYGREGKDYFWITDEFPRMIMHPYRPDLEGADLREYKDKNGLRVFVEFVNAVREKSDGYVEYLWQWEDDASRIVPKLSYVSRFDPWGWIIGTGVYLEDVEAETRALSGRLITLSAGVSVILALVLAFMVIQSLDLERSRLAAEAAIRESRERYRALVEASTEGMIIVSGGICSHANSSFVDMTGYSETELQLLGAGELFIPYADGDGESARFLAALATGSMPFAGLPPPFECSLARREREPLDIVLTSTRFSLEGKEGIILAARDSGARLGGRLGGPDAEGGAEARAETVGVGSFSARWSKRAGFLEADRAARKLFGIPADADIGQIGLFSLISDRGEGDALYGRIAAEGSASRMPMRIGPRGSPLREVVVTAFLSGDEAGAPTLIKGIVEDVSETLREERALRERLAVVESATLFLLEEIGGLASPPITCGLGTTIAEAALLSRRASAGEILVTGPGGAALGIVTRGDLVSRALAEGGLESESVSRIMSAPLRSIAPSAVVGEALEAMLGARIGRLALRGPDGSVTGFVRARDILARLGASFPALGSALEKASTIEEFAGLRKAALDGLSSLHAAGGKPRYLARLFASFHDALIDRLVQVAIRELGDPPCPFSFVVLGSAARFEQIPGSDQDNAIVFRPHTGDGAAERPYFLALGERVCRALNALGMPLCAGNIMAMNLEWCAPLATWESYFARWIGEPEPERLLDMNVFFDLRPVSGEAAIAASLRRSIFASLKARPEFFVHLARGTVKAKVPAAPSRQATEVKELAAVFSNATRAYALKEGVEATNTFERLEFLEAAGILRSETCRDAAESFEFLLGVRLSAALGGTARPRGQIDKSGLSPGEEAGLKRAVLGAVLLQKRMSFDFLGSAL